MEELRGLHQLLCDAVSVLPRHLPSLDAEVDVFHRYIIEGIKDSKASNSLPWEIKRTVQEDA